MRGVCHETPEKKRALSELRRILLNWKDHYRFTGSISPEERLYTGFSAIYTDPIKKSFFWREEKWRWNQSNAMFTATLSPSVSALVRKFNPRRCKSAPHREPDMYFNRRNLKLWTFEVTDTSQNKKCWVVWCEVGDIPPRSEQKGEAVYEHPYSYRALEALSIEEVCNSLDLSISPLNV